MRTDTVLYFDFKKISEMKHLLVMLVETKVFIVSTDKLLSCLCHVILHKLCIKDFLNIPCLGSGSDLRG